MDPIHNKPMAKQNLARSSFVAFKKEKVQEIHLDAPQQNTKAKKNCIPKESVLSAHYFIIAAIIMAGCGLLLKFSGGTNDNIAFDGLRSAAILLALGLVASCENSNRAIGRLGYHLSLAAALIIGLNFLRLGYKWFEPSLWWEITPLLSVIMGCSALLAFYKVCSARRDRSGSLFAIGITAVAITAAVRWNEGQGLSAVDPAYSITIFCLLIPVVMFRFRESITAYFQEKVAFAPMAIAGLLIVAGAVKFSSNLLPQGAAANVIETLLGEDEPAPTENESPSNQEPELDQELPEAR